MQCCVIWMFERIFFLSRTELIDLRAYSAYFFSTAIDLKLFLKNKLKQ